MVKKLWNHEQKGIGLKIASFESHKRALTDKQANLGGLEL